MVYFDYMEEQRAKNKHKKIIKYVLATLSCIVVLFSSFSITYYLLTADRRNAKPIKNNKSTQIASNQNNDSNLSNDVNMDSVDDGEKKEPLVTPRPADAPSVDSPRTTTLPTTPTPELQSTSSNGQEQINIYGQQTISAIRLPHVDSTTQDKITDIYYTSEKVCYLTFDDGPSRSVTPEILDILKQYGIKATFFVLGSSVENNPDILKRAFDEGHYIANHSYSHVYSALYENPKNVIEEYEKTEELIQDALGIPEYHSYFFRFPGGSSGGPYDEEKSIAKDLLKERNIVYTNWNCLTGDAAGNTTAEDMFNGFIETKGDQSGLVVLMHDAADKSETPKVLPQIIKYLKDEGYVFKSFYEVFQ